MDTRRYSWADRALGEIDKAIKVLTAPAVARRVFPGSPEEPALAPADRRESVCLVRVNHAGEVAAQALYQGQAAVARDPTVAAAMRNAAAEETDHLAWCEQRLQELGGRTSVFNPLWYAGSFAIGALAGALGDNPSLGFIAETEAQVEAHLSGHLQRLSAADERSRSMLEQMRADEINHGAHAASLGGSRLPIPVAKAMHLTSRLMTRASYWA